MRRPDALPVAVVVVSFETREVLGPCLESVADASPAETVVIDNGSSDGSVDLVRTRFPQVTLIASRQNLGYGAAANRAISACTAPAVLLLNSDTELTPGALEAIGRYLAEHPSVGVAGPRLANSDGSLQRSTFAYPSVSDMLMGDTGMHLLVSRLPGLRERFLRTWAHDFPRAVPWVRGAALAIRRSAFEAAGGFDERYFMYWEEVDLCRRLAEAGFETHFAPVTTVVHARAVSTGKQPAAMRREWLVGFRRYLLRHEQRPSAARMLGLLRAFATLRARRDAIRLRFTREPQRRERLAASCAGWRALLAERDLWRP